jgi:hypothetical protein
MAKQNPTIDKDPGTRDLGNGLTVVHRKEIVRSTMEMPSVDMTENMGGNPATVPTPAFASGKDLRNREGGSKNDPTPAMPGANV